MSTLILRTIQTPDNTPVSFPHGIMIGAATGAGTINNIGAPGQQGFGVGIAPSLPNGFAKLYGTDDPASDNYGNYQYSDGSVMVYVPAFFYKYGTGSNGLALNAVDIKAFSYFDSVATANASGYALHRAFYNGGSIRPGVFVDKYLCSNNNGVASSIKNRAVLSSAQRGSLSTAVFSACTANGQSPANAFHGSISAAKSRGAQFFTSTRFISGAIALLSNAHASAAVGTTYCAWYSSGSTNYPKGNNNNALGDSNDAAIAYEYDGNGTYLGVGKTGSANFFSRTTHNGQNCGIADRNGLVWEIEPIGLTSNGATYFLLNTTVDVTTITGGNTLATDAWGVTGLTAMYTDIGVTYAALTASNTDKVFGSASQVLSEATSGTAWGMVGAGVPLLTGVGGSNQFGNDYMYDARPDEMCLASGGSWNYGSIAGAWALNLGSTRGASGDTYGFRSALYI